MTVEHVRLHTGQREAISRRFRRHRGSAGVPVARFLGKRQGRNRLAARDAGQQRLLRSLVATFKDRTRGQDGG